MINHCCVFTDQLKDGKSLPIKETLEPKELDLVGLEPVFSAPIVVEGTSYLAEDHLVIQLDIASSVILPCCICNAPVNLPLVLENVYITKSLEDVSSGKAYFSDDIREAILLETPVFIECNEGSCPERIQIQNYLKQSPSKADQSQENIHYPFDHLEEQLNTPLKGESHGRPKK